MEDQGSGDNKDKVEVFYGSKQDVRLEVYHFCVVEKERRKRVIRENGVDVTEEHFGLL